MARLVDLNDVAEALDLGPHELVALTGGGGKTTLLFELGRRLRGRIVLTTTTKMGRDRTGDFPVLYSPTDDELLGVLEDERVVLVWATTSGHKAVGVAPAACDRWMALADHVVAEVDGSRGRPFKAPRPLEPVIPDAATTVVSVIGADALGRVIWDQCHRPMRVAALAGCSPFDRLSPAAAATTLDHANGGRQGVPSSARFIVVVNKVDDTNTDLVDALVAELAERAIDAVAVRATVPGP